MHRLLLEELHAAGKLDWSRAVIDSSPSARSGPPRQPHGSGLGIHRYAVERTIGPLHWFRRLRIRWEIRDDVHEALMTLAAAIICWRRLVR